MRTVMKDSECVSVWLSEGREVKTATRNLYADNHKAIYSYGSHFPLAVELKPGPNGERVILCNADKYSVATTAHQHLFFSYKLPHIPFSALAEAGIESRISATAKFKDVEIIDYIPDDQELIKYINDKGEPAERWEHKPGEVLIRFKKKSYNRETYTEVEEDKFTYLLCGMDEGHYFVCELPKEVKTIDEGFDSLKPDTIREFEEKIPDLQILRQGDLYFVRMEDMDVKSIKKDKAITLEKHFYINDTHIASYGYRNSTGGIYVGGLIKHDKGINGRGKTIREHKTVKLVLGDEKLHTKMYLAVPNLKVAAWSAGGDID
jgi:hypothetical protein